MELLKDAAVPLFDRIRSSASPAVMTDVVRFGQICCLFGEQKAMAKRADDIKLFMEYDEDEVKDEKRRTAE